MHVHELLQVGDRTYYVDSLFRAVEDKTIDSGSDKDGAKKVLRDLEDREEAGVPASFSALKLDFSLSREYAVLHLNPL